MREFALVSILAYTDLELLALVHVAVTATRIGSVVSGLLAAVFHARFRESCEAELPVSELLRSVENEGFSTCGPILVEPLALDGYVAQRIMCWRMESSVHGQFLVVSRVMYVLDHTVVVSAGAPRAVRPSNYNRVFNVLPVAVDLVWLEHLVYLMFDLGG